MSFSATFRCPLPNAQAGGGRSMHDLPDHVRGVVNRHEDSDEHFPATQEDGLGWVDGQADSRERSKSVALLEWAFSGSKNLAHPSRGEQAFS